MAIQRRTRTSARAARRSHRPPASAPANPSGKASGAVARGGGEDTPPDAPAEQRSEDTVEADILARAIATVLPFIDKQDRYGRAEKMHLRLELRKGTLAATAAYAYGALECKLPTTYAGGSLTTYIHEGTASALLRALRPAPGRIGEEPRVRLARRGAADADGGSVEITCANGTVGELVWRAPARMNWLPGLDEAWKKVSGAGMALDTIAIAPAVLKRFVAAAEAYARGETAPAALRLRFFGAIAPILVTLNRGDLRGIAMPTNAPA